jgi:hypothetical protein
MGFELVVEGAAGTRPGVAGALERAIIGSAEVWRKTNQN